MKLHTTRDIAHIMQKALRDAGFTIPDDKARGDRFEALQSAGIISQHFTITIKNGDARRRRRRVDRLGSINHMPDR
ncbi:hypothetical protein [Bradyrhizobium phage BDU-MI-1]|nr:hypothetical protein [Bradyrhizobium phage BDU-MI-1]